MSVLISKITVNEYYALPFEQRFFSCMAFSVYEVVRVAYQSRSWFVLYAPVIQTNNGTDKRCKRLRKRWMPCMRETSVCRVITPTFDKERELESNKIIVAKDATYAVAKRNPEKNSGLPGFDPWSLRHLPWVPEVFLASGGNFRCWTKADTSSAVGRSHERQSRKKNFSRGSLQKLDRNRKPR